MSFLNTAAKILEVAGQAAVAYTRHTEVQQLLSIDRETAKSLITQMVHTSQPAGIDQWERDFLNIASASLVDPAQRRRAMELYAWMKIEEYVRFEGFRGFA